MFSGRQVSQYGSFVELASVILFDFHCDVCDNSFEALVPQGVTQELCPLCGVEASRVLSAAHIGLLNDPARRAESLQKRSYEHTISEARKNQERLAQQLGGTPKSQSPWNVRSSKSSA